MSNILHAYLLWGEAVVKTALEEPAPEPVTLELAREVELRSRSGEAPVAFARWALSLPWPRFCAVARIVAGVTREDLLGPNE